MTYPQVITDPCEQPKLEINEIKWLVLNRPRFCTWTAILGQHVLMRWLLLCIIPLVQDRSLYLLTSSPACYHCTTYAPEMNKWMIDWIRTITSCIVRLIVYAGECDTSGDDPPEFRCYEGDRCIPRELTCDHYDNCGEWSDERTSVCGLGKWTIVLMSNRFVQSVGLILGFDFQCFSCPDRMLYLYAFLWTYLPTNPKINKKK